MPIVRKWKILTLALMERELWLWSFQWREKCVVIEDIWISKLWKVIAFTYITINAVAGNENAIVAKEYHINKW